MSIHYHLSHHILNAIQQSVMTRRPLHFAIFADNSSTPRWQQSLSPFALQWRHRRWSVVQTATFVVSSTLLGHTLRTTQSKYCFQALYQGGAQSQYFFERTHYTYHNLDALRVLRILMETLLPGQDSGPSTCAPRLTRHSCGTSMASFLMSQ